MRWEIRFDICRDRVSRGVSDFRFEDRCRDEAEKLLSSSVVRADLEGRSDLKA